MRHDACDSDIIQSLAFNRFAVFGYQRLSSQRGKLRPATVLDQNLTSLPWFQGDIQHNVTARPFEEQRIRPNIADRVDRQSLLDVIRRG